MSKQESPQKETVVPPDGLEVASYQWAPASEMPQAPYYHPGHANFQEKQAVEEPRKGCLPRRQLWILVLVIILVVLAAVLAGVLGTTLKHNNSNAPATTPSASAALPAPTASSRPVGIRENSPLAVTGWRTGDNFSIRLVYQNEADLLQYSAFESSTGKWTKTSNFTKAKAGGALAITNFNQSFYGTNNDYQVELFYQDDLNRINEWNWNPSTTTGHSGSLTGYTFNTNAQSQLTTYWPFIFYQDSTETLRQIVYDCSVAGCWTNGSANVSAYAGAGLAIIPETQNMTLMDLFYQRDDQKLISYSRNTTTGIFSASGSFSESIPPAAPIAAFSTLRPNDDKSSLNIYILFQDSSATVQVVWQDDDSGWKGPSTFSAFNGADNGTSIACLTASSWFNVPLQANSDMSRCYFQAGGALREVQNNGTGWEVVGYVSVA